MFKYLQLANCFSELTSLKIKLLTTNIFRFPTKKVDDIKAKNEFILVI